MNEHTNTVRRTKNLVGKEREFSLCRGTRVLAKIITYLRRIVVYRWNKEKSRRRKCEEKNLIIFYVCICLWAAFRVSTNAQHAALYFICLIAEEWTPEEEQQALEYILDALHSTSWPMPARHSSILILRWLALFSSSRFWLVCTGCALHSFLPIFFIDFILCSCATPVCVGVLPLRWGCS